MTAKGKEWFAPVVRGLSFANDQEAEAYLIAANQLTTAGGWDDGLLGSMLAQLLQEAALTIFAKAKIADMEEDARDYLDTALKMMTEGMRAERLELGEATETISLTPPKPINAMSDDELKEYIQLLEQAAA